MSKAIHLTVEKFQNGEESKYLICSPKEIRLTLNAIAQKRPDTLLYSDNEQHFFKTILLAVNEDGIWLDVGPTADDNNRITQSNDITLVTTHLGAKVQFECHQFQMTSYDSHPALHCQLPQQILRLQRRDYFRLPAFNDEPLKCIIPQPATDEKAAKTDVLTILNISEGGIALVCKENSIKLEAGNTYTGCRIELPEIGTLNTTILVRNLFEVTSPSGIVTKHAGCEFVKMDGRMSILLQRYVGIMQSRLSKLV